MKDALVIGLIVGFMAGAVYVQSNKDARKMVEKGKEALKKQL